jgi:nicotinamide riboside kinase
MIKIALIGAPGSGKSVLAADLYVYLKKLGKNVEQVPEWVRSDIHQNGPMQSIWEQFRTLIHQRTIEDAVPSNVEYVVIDSSVLTPYFYAVLYSNNKDSRQRLVMQDMYKMLLDDIFLERYTHIFLLRSDIITSDILEDGTRFQSKSEIELLDRMMFVQLKEMLKVPNLTVLSEPFENRLNIVLKTLHLIP